MPILLAVIVCLLLPLVACAQIRTPPACTAWSSPSGSGSTCSDASPCTVKTWLTSKAGPGGVLCLKSGTYTGSESMIDVPESLQGTAERPIVIRALEPGKVTIDGKDSLRPINTKGSYGIISGVNAANGDNEVVMVRGHHWLIRDLMAWNAGAGGDTVIHMSGSDNTVEDCGTWGTARKSIAAGAAGGERNTVRRCWSRWEGNEHPTSNPSNAMEMGYGQNTVTFENTIATWDTKGRVTEPEGIAQLFSSQGSKWLGSIFYLPREASFNPSRLLWGTTDTGSHAQQGDFNPTSNLLFKHILAYVDPQHSKFGSLKAFYFTEGTDQGHPPGTGNVLSDLTSIAGSSNSFSSSFPTSRVQHGTSIALAIGSGKSLWLDSYAGPGICKRYFRGELTEEGLWPWPSEQRLKDAMTLSGTQPVSVTALMESLFGPIPAQCRTTGTPPGPTPPPGVPVPPTQVQAFTRQGRAVLLTWEDLTNTVQTGYTIERKTGSGAYTMLSEAPGPQARSYVDQSPVVDATNCYVVYARGALGPSGFSIEACVAVPPAPVPPAGDHPALACDGAIREGGRVTMLCQPAP